LHNELTHQFVAGKVWVVCKSRAKSVRHNEVVLWEHVLDVGVQISVQAGQCSATDLIHSGLRIATALCPVIMSSCGPHTMTRQTLPQPLETAMWAAAPCCRLFLSISQLKYSRHGYVNTVILGMAMGQERLVAFRSYRSSSPPTSTRHRLRKSETARTTFRDVHPRHQHVPCAQGPDRWFGTW
jgi:hypothetical protein